MKIQNEKGFTLIEFLIAMTVFVTFCTSAYAMIFSMTNATERLKNSTADLASARVSLDLMANYLSLSDSYYISVISTSGMTSTSYTGQEETLSGILYTLKIKIIDTTSDEIKIFEFKQNYKEIGRNVLAFGGNDFNNYKLQILADIEGASVYIDSNKILTLTVYTGDISLSKKVDLSYKSIVAITESIVE